MSSYNNDVDWTVNVAYYSFTHDEFIKDSLRLNYEPDTMPSFTDIERMNIVLS